jgi:hypothetical protein
MRLIRIIEESISFVAFFNITVTLGLDPLWLMTILLGLNIDRNQECAAQQACNDD